MTDKIRTAYEASKNIYDDVLTQGNLFSRLYIRLFWSGTDDRKIARRVLSYIPGDFSGTLLDVPVGTAVFTERKWARLKNARITCLDYSIDMLAQAEKRLRGYSHIQCRLETGRTHQIRVHMAYRGHPILGDMVYGRKKPELGQDSQCLHAKELRFVHPRTGKPVTVSCELPDYFAALLEKLRSGYRRA